MENHNISVSYNSVGLTDKRLNQLWWLNLDLILFLSKESIAKIMINVPRRRVQDVKTSFSFCVLMYVH